MNTYTLTEAHIQVLKQALTWYRHSLMIEEAAATEIGWQTMRLADSMYTALCQMDKAEIQHESAHH
jgi:hypothetical protein